MSIFTKQVTVPLSDDKLKTVDAVQLWTVRWDSRHGRYSTDTRPEVETFTSEGEARKFAGDLRNAFNLIKHSSGTDISIEKN
jgi:hypothetical protein